MVHEVCQVFLEQQVSQDPRGIMDPLDYMEHQEKKETKGLQVCEVINRIIVTLPNNKC
jgi:hypothetical protein